MSITITLDDKVLASLTDRAAENHLSIEQFIVGMLTQAVGESETMTPEQVVERIRATPPNPSQIRLPTASIADLPRATPPDPQFDLQEWTRQWAAIEAEMKGVTRANDIAEGRLR